MIIFPKLGYAKKDQLHRNKVYINFQCYEIGYQIHFGPNLFTKYYQATIWSIFSWNRIEERILNYLKRYGIVVIVNLSLAN